MADELVELLGLVQLTLDGSYFALAAVELVEGEDLAALAVIDALEILAAADGPVHGIGPDAELRLQLLHQIVRASGLAVELVDKGEDGDVAHGADLEKLSGLRLDALGGVNDHDGGVRRHEGAVGVLGEVLVARGVEDIDAVALVLKLHDGGGDGDAALLFQLHPVGDGVARGGLAFDGARQLDRPAVEQELFGQRGFARVRVGDDGEGSAPFDFFFIIRHNKHP